jgi:prevent-host-death family protein
MAQYVNIQEAKTHLSRLLAAVACGDEVIIANRGKPVARLEPFIKEKKRRLGFVEGSLPESFFDSLSEEELRAWKL